MLRACYEAGPGGYDMHTPPVASLFAAFLGYNPIRELLAPIGVLSRTYVILVVLSAC